MKLIRHGVSEDVCFVVITGDVIQVLVELNGDVDAAIEYLIAEWETEEDLVENDKLLCQTDTSYGNGRSVPFRIPDKNLLVTTENM